MDWAAGSLQTAAEEVVTSLAGWEQLAGAEGTLQVEAGSLDWELAQEDAGRRFEENKWQDTLAEAVETAVLVEGLAVVAEELVVLVAEAAEVAVIVDGLVEEPDMSVAVLAEAAAVLDTVLAGALAELADMLADHVEAAEAADTYAEATGAFDYTETAASSAAVAAGTH